MAGKCFVPDCISGMYSVRQKCKKENKKHPEMFSAPKNWAMLQIWCHVIPNPDRKFSITDKICGLHFAENYIAKFHELPLDDGSIYKVERTYARLKPGAIPTVFPNLPRYSKHVQKIIDKMRVEFPLHIPEMDLKIDEQMENYLKAIKKVQRSLLSYLDGDVFETETDSSSSDEDINVNIDKAPFHTVDDLNQEIKTRSVCNLEFSARDKDIDSEQINLQEHKDRTACDLNVHNSGANIKNAELNLDDVELDDDDLEGVELEEENIDDPPDEITFNVLVKNLKSVSMPNNSWSITDHELFVMCAKWNKEYLPEKRVVIDRDLNIRVFLNDNEIAAYNNLCISEISDISNILSILEK